MTANKTKVAIIGSGNIGSDLMLKIIKHSSNLEMAAMVGVDADSAGLASARELHVAVTHQGIDGLIQMPEFAEIEIVFDASSAAAHQNHDAVLKEHNKQVIDLTPAAIGPFVVPVVNLDEHLGTSNINMVTCGGQATIPIVAAINSIQPVHYAEIIASIASLSAGPGTRANIDEFTVTTSRAIEQVGGAKSGKAIIVLNPAEPPLLMRNTVFCLVAADCDQSAISKAVEQMASEVANYVPGYRLKQAVQFNPVANLTDPRVSELESGIQVTVFLEIEGAADFLPAYAGNLDIMTSAAMKTAERLIEKRNEEIVS